MRLHSVEVANYQSLEDVKLECLSQFNVLIGRNNTGKSALFGALYFLNKVITGQGNEEPARRLTAHDGRRSLKIRVSLQLDDIERGEFIDQLQPEKRGSDRESLLNGPFLRRVCFSFRSPPGNPDMLHLRETTITGEDANWATIQRMTDANENTTNPESTITNFDTKGTHQVRAPFVASNLDVNKAAASSGARMFCNWESSPDFNAQPTVWWPHRKLLSYFRRAFFLNPFRHSKERLPVQPNTVLTQDGSNLAQVLHTIHSNKRKQFYAIEQFVQSALAESGEFMTPLANTATGTGTEITMTPSTAEFDVRLHEMGGGIEQLLMVATVLKTTDDRGSLFLEEPESHLHPGAQRFLIGSLLGTDRQIFTTTHSPLFVNLTGRRTSLYQLTFANGRSSVKRLNDADSLSKMLEDIGVRNSDVLLSDAVLFVEGGGDKSVFEIWARTLQTPLDERNITVLSMGGGEYVDRSAPVRTEVLEGLSGKAPIPHLFLVDRDERPPEEVKRLRAKLRDRIVVLAKRELENYLLVPRAVRSAIEKKCKDDTRIVALLEQSSDDEVLRIIRETADRLHDRVLLKRIRLAIRGPTGGLFPREMVEDLLPHAAKLDLSEKVRERITTRVEQHLRGLSLDRLVQRERETLDREWTDHDNHLVFAPGEELLAAVFAHFGTSYEKPSDTKRIACEMRAEEIDSEIKDLIGRVVKLADTALRSTTPTTA